MKSKIANNLTTILKNNTFILGIAWKISKLRFLIKVIVTIISAILPTANILLVRYIISALENDAERSGAVLQQIIIVIIGLSVAMLIPKIFSAFNTALIEPILASRINNYMNTVFFDKAKEFEYKNFEDPIFYDKYTRALKQSESMPHTVFNSFFQLLGSIIGLFALSALIISMDWIVILFAVFAVAVNFVQSIISSKLNFQTSQTLTPISRRQNYIKRVLYNAAFAKDVKCNDVIGTGKKHYFEAFGELLKVLKKYGWKVVTISIIVALLTAISSTGMMVYLFIGVWTSLYTIAEFSALMSSAGQFEGNLNSFFGTINNFYKNSLEIDNLKFVYFYKKKPSEGDLELDSKNPIKIEIKNLSFKYPNSEKYALKDVSFNIIPREKVALVGMNGSGKTTLIKLILGLYEPESGEILINGKNINQYKPEEIQKNVGVVFQDNNVFAYSAKENIAFEEDLQDSAIDVLQKLGMYSGIMSLPKGVETPLSKEFDENGILLSGGEIQKICIARALNKKTGLYIFDEPSSALDPMAEHKMNALFYEATDMTTIFISHRLATAVMADKILLMNNGELVEQGTHKELIKSKGIYNELFSMQSEKYITK